MARDIAQRIGHFGKEDHVKRRITSRKLSLSSSRRNESHSRRQTLEPFKNAITGPQNSITRKSTPAYSSLPMPKYPPPSSSNHAFLPQPNFTAQPIRSGSCPWIIAQHITCRSGRDINAILEISAKNTELYTSIVCPRKGVESFITGTTRAVVVLASGDTGGRDIAGI